MGVFDFLYWFSNRSQFNPSPCKIEVQKREACLQWESMDDFENHEKLVCTNYEEVHKSEVIPTPCNLLNWIVYFA